MTTAICIFSKTVLGERKIPFEISAESDPFYGESNMKYLRRGIEVLNVSKGTVHDLIDIEIKE